MASKATRGKLNLTATKESHIYLAGVLDADGSVCISKATAESMKMGSNYNPRYVLYMNIVNTSLELMEWLVQNFGGRYKVRKKLSENHRTTYDWRLQNNQTVEILKLIIPYLIIKKERALHGINYIDGMPPRPTGRGAKTSPDEVSRREIFYLKMKEMNQQGNTAATTKSRCPS